MIDSSGTITFNETGVYQLFPQIELGRSGGAGVAFVFLRALVDGNQAGPPVFFKLDSADITINYSLEVLFQRDAGTTLEYEMIRDSAGNNSGELTSTTSSVSGWGTTPSACINIYKVSSIWQS